MKIGKQTLRMKISTVTGLYSGSQREELKKLFSKLNKGGKPKATMNKIRMFLMQSNTDRKMQEFTALPADKIGTAYLNDAELLIKTLKVLYQNGQTPIDDTIYDAFIEKFEHYRVEPQIEQYMVESNEKLKSTKKRILDTVHQYPELKGNIHKCRYMIQGDVPSDEPGAQSLERFLNKCYECSNKEILPFRLSLKYDGVSIIISVDEDGNVILALTRGKDGAGADVTHMFSDIKFPKLNEPYGIKTEMIITAEDKTAYEEARGLNEPFKNLRMASSSLINLADNSRYVEYATFVPLKCTLPDVDLNIFAKKVQFKFRDMELSKSAALKEIKNMITDTIVERPNLNFAIDGIVIECLDEDVVRLLGETNDYKNYQIAYKFPPLSMKIRAIEYDCTVGRTGVVTPILKFAPVLLNGCRFDHVSMYSMKKVEAMGIKYFERLKLILSNDVMPKVTKYDKSLPDDRITVFLKVSKLEGSEKYKNQLLEVPKQCRCGSFFELEGANLYCKNPNCPEKILAKITFFYETLGIRDVSENTVRDMLECGAITGFDGSMMKPQLSKLLTVRGYSDIKINKFQAQIEHFIKHGIEEDNLLTALSIGGTKTNREILIRLGISDLFKGDTKLFDTKIEGIGMVTKEKFYNTFISCRDIINSIGKTVDIISIKKSKEEIEKSKESIKVMFTGIRPDEKLKTLMDLLGFEMVENSFRGLAYVVTVDKHADTIKLKKARNRQIPIYSYNEFIEILKDMQ